MKSILGVGMRLNLVVLCLWGVASAASAKSLVSESELIFVTTDYWCPLLCRGDSPRKGTFYDIARKIWPEKKITIKNFSFPRAKDMVLRGQATAFPAILKKEMPTLVYPKKPGSILKFCVYSNPDKAYEYKNVESLRGKRIGFIKDYGYPSSIRGVLRSPKKFGVQVEQFIGKNVLVKLSRAAFQGKIDLFIEDEWVVNYGLLTNQLAHVEKKGCVADGIDFGQFGISPKLPYAQKLAAQWDAGMKTLQDSGDLKKIFSRYGVPGWEYTKPM